MKKLSTFFASITLFSCIGFSAFGDDLDIYLGNANNAVTYNPNVLFIMDSSGSMGSYDNTDQSRMLRVQNALKEAQIIWDDEKKYPNHSNVILLYCEGEYAYCINI